MEQIYLDHAATSFPKPHAVGQRMLAYVDEIGANINRGVYSSAQQVGKVTLSLRRQLASLFDLERPDHVVLTPGNTWGLNMLLRGALRPGDHCLVSSMEHNAVMRPLQLLKKQGVEFDRIPCDRTGRLEPADVDKMLQPRTKLVLLAHASNVSGTVQDAAAAGEICEKRGVPLVLDAAQTAGHIPVSMKDLHLSAISVPGHKGLMGPQGIGALLLQPDFAELLSCWFAGGTGSISDSEEQPDFMPDKFEGGTPNLPGIYGWEAALRFISSVGIDQIADHERALSERFLSGVKNIAGVRLIGPDTSDGRVGVFSLDFPGQDNGEIAFRLEQEYGILTRCGLHCAPAAHQTLGTFPRGTVRFSFGWTTTEQDVDQALTAIRGLSAE